MLQGDRGSSAKAVFSCEGVLHVLHRAFYIHFAPLPAAVQSTDGGFSRGTHVQSSPDYIPHMIYCQQRHAHVLIPV